MISLVVYSYQIAARLRCGNDSCRLLVLNLLSFVKNPFTKDAYFDYVDFASKSQIAQRLMDDLIDLEIEKMNTIIKKIEDDPEPEDVKAIELNLWKNVLKSCMQGRRTGTGITALGDTLAALNIKYGSKESIEVTGEIYRQLMINTYKSTCIMAGERGTFPIFEAELEKGQEFIEYCLSQDDELRDLYNKNGRRNIALLTTAPTGSVSSMTQTSSGIEPVFMLSYTRRKKHNPSDKNARVDFVDAQGDSWQEFTVYHHGVKRWMDITGEIDIKKSPYYGATANEIDWVAGVEIQAIAQKSIDHSISKTCVTGDTLIETNKGLLYMDEIIDFSNNNSSIENYDILVKNHNGDMVKPSHIHTMGIKNIIKVTLDNNVEINVTPLEKFLFLDEELGTEEWKPIEELCIGDRIRLG